MIEKYAPSRAAQIRVRNRNKGLSSSSNSAANTVAVSAVTNTAVVTTASIEADRKAKTLEARIDAEKKLTEDVEGLGTKTLAKDERDKIVVQARKIISQTPGRDKKITALSLLAAQVAKAGDKELATEIMKDAEGLVNPLPKNYQDFIITWMLISGYAEVDANKAFPMLTDTILRLNETISAFVKAAEFIDAQGEMISDGEVQVGQFGGSMLRGLTKELKIAEPTLKNLVKADFAKTRAVTNSFDRPEARVLAKMMVLRAILATKDPSNEDLDIGLVLNQ